MAKQKPINLDNGGDVEPQPKDVTTSGSSSDTATSQSTPPPSSSTVTAQTSMRKAFKYKDGGEVDEEGRPIANEDKEQYGRELEAGTHSANPSAIGPFTPGYAATSTREKAKGQGVDYSKAQSKANGGEIKKYAEGTPDGPIPLMDTGEGVGPQGQSAPPATMPAQTPYEQIMGTPPPVSPAQITQGIPVGPAGPMMPTGAMQAPPQAPPQAPAAPMPTPEPAVSDAELDAAAKDSTAPQEQQPQQTPDFTRGFNEQMQGITKGAEAEAAAANAQAEDLRQGIEKQQEFAKSFQENYTSLNNERLAHLKDIEDGHIDPNKYWDNHSKLAAGIGMILAGFNMTDRPNAAIDFLKHQMDLNIKGQAANLESKQNLLRANLQQFGNLRDAASMTKVMQSDMLANKLKMEAAKATDPLVKARAMETAGKLEMASMPEFMNLSMRRALIQSAEGGGNGPKNPEQLLSILRVMNPPMAKEMESRYVPGVGFASVPIEAKSREEITSRESLQTQVRNLRDWAAKHSGEFKLMNPTDVNYGQALAKSVQDAYRRANGQGVFREAESNFVKGIVDDKPTAFFNKFRTDPKYKALEDSNLIQLNAVKKMHGLPESQPSAYNAPQFATKGGIKYQKVPGGWKKVD